MIAKYTQTADLAPSFSHPEGSWIGRLEDKAYGSEVNVTLLITDIAANKKYWLPVSLPSHNKLSNSEFDFKNDAQPGDIFVLITEKDDGGNTILLSARRILKLRDAPSREEIQPAY